LLCKINPKLAKKHLRHYDTVTEVIHQVATVPGPSGSGVTSGGPTASQQGFEDSNHWNEGINIDLNSLADATSDKVIARQVTTLVLPSDTIYQEVEFPDSSPDLPEEPDNTQAITPRAYSDNKPTCVQIVHLKQCHW